MNKRQHAKLENEHTAFKANLIATAGSAEEGLVTLRAQAPFAAVVSDMQMNGVDGVQFLKHAP